jgi:hypothetical protein
MMYGVYVTRQSQLFVPEEATFCILYVSFVVRTIYMYVCMYV